MIPRKVFFKKMKIVIPGKPIAKKRPRFVRRGKFVGTYNDQETEEGKWLLLAKSQITKKCKGAVSIKCMFYMPIPKNTPKKNIDLIKEGYIVPHAKKPDLDNLIKFVKDCLNEFAWQDDSQVYKIKGLKIYGIDPKTEIKITEITN